MPTISNRYLPIAKSILKHYAVEMPKKWLEGVEKVKITKDPLPCDSWEELIGYWQLAMYWSADLQYALSCSLATVASTMSIGDQLWMRIISPPASGKSTIAEALSCNKQWVLAKSTIRGFHSGYGDGREDLSLASQLAGKTLVTKDGDTLLRSPNVDQILSEARDVYDTVSRTSYRNKASKDYEGLRVTWLLYGTDSLRSLDESELGERFLDCIMMKKIDDNLEDQILESVITRADKGMGVKSDNDSGQQQSPELEEAMRRTAGYINYLRDNAQTGMQAIRLTKNQARKIAAYAKYVAYMRARPSSSQKETATRELATRVASQLTRLVLSMSFVEQRNIDEIMDQVKRVTRDTADGLTIQIMEQIEVRGKGDLNMRSLEQYMQMESKDLLPVMRFLIKIGAVSERRVRTKTGGVRSRSYVLSKKFKPLWDTVWEEEE